MKKIILTIAFIASGLVASAQVGIGNTDPKVSLQVDKSADAAKADGVLVPRVTVAELNTKAAAYGADQNGSLVFVTAITGAANETSNVTATGFHYYNSGTDKWVAVGGADTSLYAGNGQLTGARTVDQNNNNLTFTTGTARAIVNGSFESTGAVYAKYRVEDTANASLLSTDWSADDYAVLWTNSANGANTASLPDATLNTGRVISLANQSGGNHNYVAGAAFKPAGQTAINSGKGHLVISNGSTWVLIGGF